VSVFGGAVAECFVAAADGIVVHGDGIQEKFGEAFAEVPSGDAGHGRDGQGLDFMEAEGEKFSEGDGINVGVVGAGAVPGHEKWHAFMEIVDDGGVPIEEHVSDGFGGFLGELMGVAIDVHKNVFAQ